MVLKYKANFVIRLRSNSFNLYDSKHQKFDLTERMKNWKLQEVLNFHLFRKIGKEYIPVRVCAVAKTEEQIEKSIQHIKKSNKGRKKSQ
jgi:hypothetical protein